VPGVHRIRHVQKGRYGDNKAEALIRGNIRRVKAAIKARWQKPTGSLLQSRPILAAAIAPARSRG